MFYLLCRAISLGGNAGLDLTADHEPVCPARQEGQNASVSATNLAVTSEDMLWFQARCSASGVFLAGPYIFIISLDAGLIPDCNLSAFLAYMFKGGSAVHLLLRLSNKWLLVVLLVWFRLYRRQSAVVVKPLRDDNKSHAYLCPEESPAARCRGLRPKCAPLCLIAFFHVFVDERGCMVALKSLKARLIFAA